jgi:two-component system, OmpR family, alkaline phosphatase synthesis response regulator PhoP
MKGKSNNKKKILVVEDNESLRKIIQLKLKEARYDAVLAKDAEEAFKNLEDSLPDLIWLDIYLPRMNGLDFLNELRTDSKTKNLKVVIVSVSGSDKKKAAAEKLGISDFLVKSNYKIEEIIERIGQILNK